MELTVLGCSGSYGGPEGNACSGYLVRDGATAIWLDSGNGTFGNLQQHVSCEDLTAVVITHEHPDHCSDIYGLHVLARYGIHRSGIPVFTPAGLEHQLGALVHNDWADVFAWQAITDGMYIDIGSVTLNFSRTDHPPPTFAVEFTAEERRLIYTADTGPEWTVGAFAPGAELVLSEATYLDGHKGPPIHLSAHEAGAAARAARAQRLMITHLWPRTSRDAVVAEASAAFGAPVILAAPHLVTQV